MSQRIPDNRPLSPWEETNRVMEETNTIERLAELHMKRGNVSRADALRWAIGQWKQQGMEQVDQPYRHLPDSMA